MSFPEYFYDKLTSKTTRKPAWNKGRIIGPKKPLAAEHVWAIRTRLELEERHFDLALFNLAIDSKLRGCDLVSLKVGDVMQVNEIKPRVTISQRKTGHNVTFEICPRTASCIRRLIELQDLGLDDFLFPSQRSEKGHISTATYARRVKSWVSSIGLQAAQYSTHSMRRTKATLIYKSTKNIRAVQLLLGHTKLDSTVRYLGVDLDDALSISENIEI